MVHLATSGHLAHSDADHGDLDAIGYVTAAPTDPGVKGVEVKRWALDGQRGPRTPTRALARHAAQRR